MLFNRTYRQVSACFSALSQLNQALFSCYLAGDYFERHFFYEKEFHYRRKECLQKMAKLQRNERLKQSDLILYLEIGYEIFMSMGLLLYRIKDHTTFGVAKKDLTAITENITSLFHFLSTTVLKKKLNTVNESLTENIQQLEEVNRNALQVVANDPMAFLLFIHDLRALDNVLMNLSTAIATLHKE